MGFDPLEPWSGFDRCRSVLARDERGGRSCEGKGRVERGDAERQRDRLQAGSYALDMKLSV